MIIWDTLPLDLYDLIHFSLLHISIFFKIYKGLHTCFQSFLDPTQQQLELSHIDFIVIS